MNSENVGLWLSVIGTILSIVSIGVAITIPEIRCILRLEQEKCAIVKSPERPNNKRSNNDQKPNNDISPIISNQLIKTNLITIVKDHLRDYQGAIDTYFEKEVRFVATVGEKSIRECNTGSRCIVLETNFPDPEIPGKYLTITTTCNFPPTYRERLKDLNKEIFSNRTTKELNLQGRLVSISSSSLTFNDCKIIE